MALSIGELVGYLRLDTTKFDGPMGKAKAGMQSAGQQTAKLGQDLTTRVSLPLAGVGIAAIKMSGDFEASMNGVRAVTGATGDDFDQLSGLAKTLGSTTQFSASEAAAAMEFLGMAGLKTKDIMSALPDVLNLAAAGNTDLATTADIASNIMSGFGIEASEMGRISDVLAKAMASTNVDLQMLGESMKYAAPLAKAAGWSLEETAAAVGFLGNAGIQGSNAGTGLNSILATLADTSSTGGKKLKEFGVAAQDSNGQVRPLTDVMADLADKGAGVADIISIFGLEAGPKLQALLGQGSEGVRALITDLENSEGAAADMAAIRMEGLNGQLKSLQSAGEGLMIAIGDTGLLGEATKLVAKFTEWTQTFASSNPETMRMAIIVAAVVAAIGPLLIIVGKTITLIGSSVVAIGKFVSATWGAIAAIGRWTAAGARWAAQAVLHSSRAVAAWIRSAAVATASAATAGAAYVAGAAKVVGAWILMGIQATIAGIQMAAAWLAAIWPIALVIAAVALVAFLVIKYWDDIVKWTKIAWEWVVGAVKAAWDWVVDLFFRFTPLGLIISNWGKIVNATKAAFGLVKDGIKRAWDWVVDLFYRFHPLGLIISNFDKIVSFIRGLPGRIRSAASGLFDGIKDAFRSAVNWIISKWNGLSFSLPSASIPGLGKVGGGRLSVPPIPMLAQGGIIPASPAGRLFLGGEGGEPEAVAPLSKLTGMIRDAVSDAGGETTVNVYLDGKLVDARVEKIVSDRDRRTRRQASSYVGGPAWT